jgi:two-component system response regulator AtoC
LLTYSFNGNIRELEHIIERAIIFAESEYIQPDDLNLPNISSQSKASHFLNDNGSSEDILSMEEIEKEHIARALTYFKWDRAQTASRLGISPKTLYTKIKKYEIKQE